MKRKRLQFVLALLTAATGAWAQSATTTYSVNLNDGSDNPTTWTGKVGEATTFSALPLEGVAEGQTVTLKYSGRREVKSITATVEAEDDGNTVKWNSTNASGIDLHDSGESFTAEGITLSNNKHNSICWYSDGGGIQFVANMYGGFTFTAPTDKKFTKIEMTLKEVDPENRPDWPYHVAHNMLGTGWPSGDAAATQVSQNKKVAWTGTAASTVDLLTAADGFYGGFVTSIVFTLVDAE